MEETKILVVEDEMITAMDLQRTLQNCGYQVPFIASSGEEAIEIFENINPDLVLMDIVLKGKMDGTEAAYYISRKFHTPIIFLTAFNDPTTFNRAKESMPYGYLTKPFDQKDLLNAIELVLFKHHMEMESQKEMLRLKNEFIANMSHELRTPVLV